jgi:hypothetical protein
MGLKATKFQATGIDDVYPSGGLPTLAQDREDCTSRRTGIFISYRFLRRRFTLANEREITLSYNPIADAEKKWLWVIAWLASDGGQIGPLGDTDFTAVALSALIVNRVEDEAYRKTVLMGAAEYIKRAAEKPAANVGKQPKAA